MITELSAQNFKSWQDTGSLHFAPLTGFFGANSSGKSSILQVLLMLKQTAEQPLEWDEPLDFGDEESLVDLRSFDDIIYQPIGEPSLGISVSWELSEKITFMNRYQSDTLSFYFNLINQIVQCINYQFGEHQYAIEVKSGTGGYEVKYPSDREDAQSILRDSKKPFRCYGIRDGYYRDVKSKFEEAFENLFNRIHYLGPRREDPRRYYSWEDSHPKGIGRYGEKMISAWLSGRVRRRSIDEQIMKWLQELDLIYSYTLSPLSDTEQTYELLVKQYKDGPEVGLTDVGFGVSQILPVLTSCYALPEGSILVLEQPDAHLHPKVQSELADVLIDVVKNRNIQIILESHSEHLLLRLMRRIAEYGVKDEGIPADQTAFYFCEINDGNSKAEQLKVDEYGNISNWPKDFFGDEMGDLAAKTKAEMQRRKAKKR